MSNQIAIEYLFVANYAEVTNGLLNMIGGGFTDLYRPKTETPYTNTFSVALSLSIPQDEANRLHTITVRLEDQENKQVLSEAHASMNLSVPLDLPEQTEVHVIVAVQFHITFPAPGSYRVVGIVDTEENNKKWSFTVHDVVKGT